MARAAQNGRLIFCPDDGTVVWEDVIATCPDSFERCLDEQSSGLRRQIAQMESSIRQDVTRIGAEHRQEIASLHARMDSNRLEFLKWAFILSIGQLIAMGTLFGLIMQFSPRG